TTLHPFPTRRSSDLDGHFANSAPDLSTRLGSHSRATLLNSSARPGQKCLTSTCANGRSQSLAVSSSTPRNALGLRLHSRRALSRSEEHTSELQSREN